MRASSQACGTRRRIGATPPPSARFWRRPLDADQVGVPLGEVTILEDRCKGCGFCVEFCPTGVLELAAHFNPKGYHPPVVVRSEACVGCHLCELLCPEFAIFSRETSAVGSPAGHGARGGPSDRPQT